MTSMVGCSLQTLMSPHCAALWRAELQYCSCGAHCTFPCRRNAAESFLAGATVSSEAPHLRCLPPRPLRHRPEGASCAGTARPEFLLPGWCPACQELHSVMPMSSALRPARNAATSIWSPAVATTLLTVTSMSCPAALLSNHQRTPASVHWADILGHFTLPERCTHSSPFWTLVLQNPGLERSTVPAAGG